LWPQLNAGQTLISAESWQLMVIRQGLGEVCAATSELFIPQMLNYHLTGAISFTKGCYTGQEVIARMHYKGKLKRQLYRISLQGQPCKPGDDLFGPDSVQSIGKIVNCVAVCDDNSEALAVITSANVDADNVVFRPTPAAAGADAEINRNIAVNILALPYTIAQ
jgi:folate-binding protein YgfZ